MVRNGVTAAPPAASVGYESASQFSREFKRLFGRSPVRRSPHAQNFAMPRPAAGFDLRRVALGVLWLAVNPCRR